MRDALLLRTGCLLLLLTLTAWCGTAWGDIGRDHWEVDDYRAAHPEQVALMDAFAARVAAPAQAVAEALLPPTPLRVAVLYPGDQASDYWRRNMAAFRARMAELNLEVVLDVHFTGPGSEDAARQADLLRQALAADPDYLFYTLDTPIHQMLIERLLARSPVTHDGPRLILQNITTPLRAWNKMQPFLYVGFDHVIGSRALARQLIAAVGPEGGDAVVLYGTSGYVSAARGGTFIEETLNSPLTVRGSYTTEMRVEVARTATLDAIKRYPDLRVIYACTTDVALGAMEGVKLADASDRILVSGWGGGEDELEALRRGDLAATVMRINDDAGVAMAEAIALDLRGESEMVPTIFSGTMEVVTRNTPASEIESLKRRAFRYSGVPTPGAGR